MMGNPARAPYSRNTLLIYKLLSLVHDPPFKPYFLGKGHERIAVEIAEPILCLALRMAEDRTGLKNCLDEVITHRKIEGNRRYQGRGWRSHPVPRRADVLASGFDRYLFDYGFTRLACPGAGAPSFRLCGLANIFLPRLGFLRHIEDNIVDSVGDILKDSAARTIASISCALRDALIPCGSRIGVSREWFLYSFFSYLYEPEIYMGLRERVAGTNNSRILPENCVCPADTRVPHHSVFDHLYASATAANMVSRSYEVYDFILVRISLGYIREWLAGSRKLSDLWLSSWMIGAWMWYMVEELVDKYGPDILVYPEMRWNQHFSSHLYTLLAGQKGSEKLREHVDTVAEKIYWLDKEHPFPHYAWLPAQAYLVIPVVKDPVDTCGGDGEGGGTGSVKDRVKNQMRCIEEHILRRYTGFWDKIIDSIIENNVGGDVREALEEVRGKPPLPLKMTLIAVYHEGRGIGGMFLRHVHAYCGGRGSDCLDTVLDKEDISPDDLVGRAKQIYGEEVLVKLLYTLAFWLSEIIDKYSETRLRPPNTVSHVGGKPRDIHGGYWRHCSVCRHGVAVIHAPRNTNEYGEFAQRLGIPAEQLEKIIKPGENLCPYCLVKRLAGTISKNSVVEKFFPHMKGSRGVDIYFPATDDVAGLAHKLGLVEAITIIAENTDKLGGGDTLDRIADRVRRVIGGDGAARTRYFYAPWLLARAVENMKRILGDRYRGLAGMIEALISEPLYDLLDDKEKREKYAGLIDFLVKTLKRLMGNEARRGARILYRDLLEALRRPRINYAIVYFDADIVSRIMAGLLPLSIGVRSQEYLDITVYSQLLLEAVEDAVKNTSEQEGSIRYGKVLKMVAEEIKDILRIILRGEETVPASLPTTPSYHRAVSNAILHFMYKAATTALLLGGLPVYMGGDNGLVIMPSWLPLSIAAYAVKGESWDEMLDDVLLPYRELVENILGEEGRAALGERLDDPCSPPLLYVYLLRKIYWGSASGSSPPGFLPVTVKPRLFTDPLYYIPAITVSGLSIGVKHAHYKDHMYYELVGAMNLAAYSKTLGGDTLTVMYGRPPTPVALGSPSRIEKLGGVETMELSRKALVPCLMYEDRRAVEELIRGAGDVLGAALLLDTLVQQRILSRSFYGDLEAMLGEEGIVDDRALWASLLYRMMQRNLALRRADKILLRLETQERILERITGSGGDPLNTIRAARVFYKAGTRSINIRTREEEAG